MTELKEERKEEAWKNIQSLNNQLWKTIKKECKEIKFPKKVENYLSKL